MVETRVFSTNGEEEIGTDLASHIIPLQQPHIRQYLFFLIMITPLTSYIHILATLPLMNDMVLRYLLSTSLVQTNPGIPSHIVPRLQIIPRILQQVKLTIMILSSIAGSRFTTNTAVLKLSPQLLSLRSRNTSQPGMNPGVLAPKLWVQGICQVVALWD